MAGPHLNLQERIVKATPVLASMILASAAVFAAEREPQINIIFSAENATCTAWAKSADNKLVRQQYEIWARGFASGYNYATPSRQVKVGAFPSGDDLYQYFDQYCRDHPQQSFVAGAIQLVEQLADANTPAKPAAVRKPPAPVAK
jgi:hypothetical protein